MNPEPTTMDTFLNAALLIGIAAMNAFGLWWTKRTKDAQSSAETKIDQVIVKQDEIHKMVNSPLGIALESLAVVYEQRARETKSESDILAYSVARRESDSHKKMQAAVDSEKDRVELDKQKIIAEFLESTKAKP